MSFEGEFLSMMTSTAQVKAETGRNGYGVPTFGSPVSVPCHVSITTKIVRGNTEETTNSTAQIELPPPGYVVGTTTVPTVHQEDHVTLSDGIERRVLDVIVRYDESGTPHHQTAALT